jgi:diguanylate cyclase (GGDEF)-like protein
VNDTHGHPAGDALLCHVANVLHNGLQRQSDTVFRYGGEELVIVVDGRTNVPDKMLGAEGFASIAERLRQALGSTLCDMSGVETMSDAKALSITASFGVAAFMPPRNKDQRRESFESWLARADRALYKAKGKTPDGKDDPNEPDARNRVCYDSGGTVTVLDRQPKMPQPSSHERSKLIQTLTI